MSNKMKIVIGSFISFIIISVSIGVFIGFTTGHIEDTNGINNELNTLVIEDNIQSTNHTNMEFASSISYSRNKTGIEGTFSDIDYDNIKRRAGKFSGVDELQHTLMRQGDSLEFQIELVVEKGNFVIVFLDPNNIVLEIVDNNDDSNVLIENCVTGVYRVLIFGESAKFKLEIYRI